MRTILASVPVAFLLALTLLVCAINSPGCGTPATGMDASAEAGDAGGP